MSSTLYVFAHFFKRNLNKQNLKLNKHALKLIRPL